MSRPLLFLFLICLISLTRSQYQIEDTDPLTKEQFEKVFEELNIMKNFNSLPYVAFLFARGNDLVDRSLVPLLPYCLVQLTSDGEAQIHTTCMDIVQKYHKADPTLSNVLLAYRCFKSDNPYDYDLHTAEIEDIQPLPRYESFSLHFTPQKSSKCKVKNIKNSPVNLEHFKEEGYIVSATEGTDPITKEVYEQAFQIKKYFRESPYLTYIFKRNLKTLATKLEPIQECLVQLQSKGIGVIHEFCASMLDFFKKMDAKLPNVVLPYRCVWHNDTTQYDLHVVSIDDLSKATDGKTFLIIFTPKESDHCAPIWANEHHKNNKLDLKLDAKLEHAQYLKSLTKKRFEQAFTDMGYKAEFEKYPSLGYLFIPDLENDRKILIPHGPCIATLFRCDKAAVSPACAAFLTDLDSMDKTWEMFKSIHLVYRCYLLYNQKEYELHTANIKKIGMERGEMYIYFTPQESEHCRPVWREDHPFEEYGEFLQKQNEVDQFHHDEL